jgi:hypothetical protein
MEILEEKQVEKYGTVQLTFLPYFPYHFTIQLILLPYFPYIFTIQLTFLPYFPYHFTIQLTLGSDVTGSDVIFPALFSYHSSSTFLYGKYG